MEIGSNWWKNHAWMKLSYFQVKKNVVANGYPLQAFFHSSYTQPPCPKKLLSISNGYPLQVFFFHSSHTQSG